MMFRPSKIHRANVEMRNTWLESIPLDAIRVTRVPIDVETVGILRS